MTEKDYLEICLEDCGKMMTKEDIINSPDCNLFCDVPYILLEIERRENLSTTG